MDYPLLSPRQQAINFARQILENNPLYLDTETTGLEKQDEIIEISIINDAAEIVFQSLVKPTQSIPASATRIHGLTDEMVQKAPAWPILWMQIRPLLINKHIVIYNAEFDIRMLQQSHAKYRLPWKDNLSSVDLLRIYAQFRGEWDNQRRSWKYISLSNAGIQCGISLPNAHRATADTLLTRAVLHFIANS